MSIFCFSFSDAKMLTDAEYMQRAMDNLSRFGGVTESAMLGITTTGRTRLETLHDWERRINHAVHYLTDPMGISIPRTEAIDIARVLVGIDPCYGTHICPTLILVTKAYLKGCPDIPHCNSRYCPFD